MANILEVATYGRNSDKRQLTSQAIQADEFQQFMTAGDDGKSSFEKLFGRQGVIVENYKDHGKSASKKKSKRQDFDRMLNDVALGKVKIVLILNTSRFSRLHPADTVKFLTTFRDNGTKLVSIQDRKVIETEELGDLISTIVKFNADHEYSRSLAANVLRGTVSKIKNEATSHVANIPYGMAKLVIMPTGEERIYPRTDNIRLPEKWKGYLIAGDETEVEIVRWIFQTYLESDISYCEITRRLNNHKNSTVRAGCSGKGWHDDRIKSILSNRHYRGQVFIGRKPSGEHYRVSEGKVVPVKQAVKSTAVIVEAKFQDKYPPVIEPETFEHVQAKLSRKFNSKPKSKTTDGYCLTGSLVCGHCGGALCADGKGKFVCTSGNAGQTACKQWGVREREVLPWLVNRIDKELWKKLQDKPLVEPSPDTTVIRRKIEEIDAKCATISAQLIDVTIETCNQLTTVLKNLGDEKARLQSQIHDDNYHHRLAVAQDHWEEMVQPYLVSIKTGNLGNDNPAVKKLGIQDEVDRLFNFVDAKASKVREMLQSMATKVVCHFKTKPFSGDKRYKGIRSHYALDYGQVSVSIGGISSNLQERDIPQSACR